MLRQNGNWRGKVNLMRYITRCYRGLIGRTVEFGVNLTNRKVIFKDKYNYLYFLAPGDDIATYYANQAITDSTNVVNYILKHLEEGSICIDIGSRIGGISIPMWHKSGLNGKVISVEADPQNIKLIKENLRLNQCPSNYVYNAAVTDHNGVVQLRCYEGINGWQTLGNPGFASTYKSNLIEVTAITFSDLMDEFKLNSIDLVKIDVEGAEPMVLSGMARFLQEKRINRVIFEVNYLMLEGFDKTVDDLMHIWDNYDYDLYRLLSDGTLSKLSDEWPEEVIGDCIAFAR